MRAIAFITWSGRQITEPHPPDARTQSSWAWQHIQPNIHNHFTEWLASCAEVIKGDWVRVDETITSHLEEFGQPFKRHSHGKTRQESGVTLRVKQGQISAYTPDPMIPWLLFTAASAHWMSFTLEQWNRLGLHILSACLTLQASSHELR